ncbi:MAG: efflux RND transporter periplasmic adaptor subunit [Chloroflexota bacterium]
MTDPRYGAGALAIAALIGLAACKAQPTETVAEPAPEVSVTVAPIKRATLRAYVQGWGRVEPEPASGGRPAASARVTAPVAGVVTAVLSAEGQHMAQGTTMFRLDGRVADVAVERARQAVVVAEQLVRRQEELGPGQATSQKAYQEAAAQLNQARSELSAAELQRRLLDVQAPISGTVVTLNARLGDAIDPSTALAELIDLSRLVVRVSIRSVDVARVTRGQRVEIVSNASPGETTGPAASTSSLATVDYIGAQVDAATDTVTVRARAAVGSAIRPGQFVDVRIVTDERRDRLVVPAESIVRGAGGNEIAVVNGNTAIKQRVTLGLSEGGVVEIQGDGLREGLSVVVQGAYGLPPTSQIKVMGR